MVSKKSYFNLTIFFNNIGRHWPIWTGYIFLLVFTGPFSLFMSNSNHSFRDKELFLYKLSTTMNICASPIIISIFVILSAMAVFSYQFSARSSNAIHALPISREGLFITNYLCGLAYLIVPQLINYLLTTLVTVGIKPSYADNLHPWILSCLFVTVMLYSTMVMFCMFSGNFFWPPVLFIIGNLLYVGIKFLVLGLGHLLLYGVTTQESSFSQKDSLLSPLFHLTNAHTFYSNDDPLHKLELVVHSTDFYLPYMIATLVIILIAFLLYKHRKIECVGDVLCYKSMRPFFLWLASLCMIALLTEFFTSFFFSAVVYLNESHFRVIFIFVIAFSFLCFFFIEMIIKKRFRIFTKKKVIESFVFTTFVVISLCCIRYDIFHLESKIPDTSDIKNVEIDYFYQIKGSTQAEINFIRKLHKQLLDQKNTPIQRNDDVHSISLTYNLKNGHKLERVYPFKVSTADYKDPNSIPGLTSNMFNNYERLVNHLRMKQSDQIKSNNVSFNTPDLYDEKTGNKMPTSLPSSLNQILNSDLLIPILNAYLEDVKAGNIQAYPTQLKDADKERYYTTTITLSYSTPQTDDWTPNSNNFFYDYSLNTNTYKEDHRINYDVTLQFNSQCTNLIKLLEDHGLHSSDLRFVQLDK